LNQDNFYLFIFVKVTSLPREALCSFTQYLLSTLCIPSSNNETISIGSLELGVLVSTGPGSW
jgi:hypothetical protein